MSNLADLLKRWSSLRLEVEISLMDYLDKVKQLSEVTSEVKVALEDEIKRPSIAILGDFEIDG